LYKVGRGVECSKKGISPGEGYGTNDSTVLRINLSGEKDNFGEMVPIA